MEYEFGCSGIKKFFKVFIFPGLMWNKYVSKKKKCINFFVQKINFAIQYLLLVSHS